MTPSRWQLQMTELCGEIRHGTWRRKRRRIIYARTNPSTCYYRYICCCNLLLVLRAYFVAFLLALHQQQLYFLSISLITKHGRPEWKYDIWQLSYFLPRTDQVRRPIIYKRPIIKCGYFSQPLSRRALDDVNLRRTLNQQQNADCSGVEEPTPPLRHGILGASGEPSLIDNPSFVGDVPRPCQVSFVCEDDSS